MAGRCLSRIFLARSCLICLQFAVAYAQQPATRGEGLRAQQLRKSTLLTPEERTAADIGISKATKFVMENLAYGIGGIGVRFGGLATGQGFALGPQYSHYGLAEGRLVLRGSAAGSAAGAYLFDLQLTVPRMFDRKAFVDFLGTYANYPRIDYYGRGPDSSRGGRWVHVRKMK